MKKFQELLKGARHLELILAVVAVPVNLLQTATGRQWQGSELENRLSAILSRIDGAGTVEVMITEDAQGEAQGILVVADGAEDLGIYLRLQYAVQSLLGVETSRIEIMPRDG